MRLLEFLEELSGPTNVVIIDNSERENEFVEKERFPNIIHHISFYGKKWEAVMEPNLETLEITCVDLTKDNHDNPYIAIYVADISELDWDSWD